MVGLLRRSGMWLLAAVLAAVAGAAAAKDYVVVASTNPAMVRGQSLDAGTRVALTPGQTLTLLHASGAMLTLKGQAGGVVVPKRAVTQNDADRLDILKFVLTPAEARPVGKTRGGVCPPAEAFTDLDAIAQASAGRCSEAAAQALEAWMAHQPQETQ